MPINGIYFHRMRYLFSHPGFLFGKIFKNGIEFAFYSNVQRFGFLLNIVSVFGQFYTIRRALDLKTLCLMRQNHWSLTWPRGPGFR